MSGTNERLTLAEIRVMVGRALMQSGTACSEAERDNMRSAFLDAADLLDEVVSRCRDLGDQVNATLISADMRAADERRFLNALVAVEKSIGQAFFALGGIQFEQPPAERAMRYATSADQFANVAMATRALAEIVVPAQNGNGDGGGQ